MKKEFTKDDLKPGMIIEEENGTRCLLSLFKEELFGISNKCWFSLENYDNFLYYKLDSNKFIKKIYLPTSVHHFIPKDNFRYITDDNLIWQRQPEKKQLTVAQIEEKLGHPVEVIRG